MKFKFLLLSSILFFSYKTMAAELDMNMAQMQAMDKITGRVSIIEVPVGGAVSFGSFSVVVRSCKSKTEEEIPENFAFVDVTDKSFDKEEYNIFKGWMLSSSPAVNAVEHPIYDVWLLKCFNGEPKKELLLSQEQLTVRDNLPRLNDVVTQNKTMKQNTFIVQEEPQNISFKDAMYKEEVKPEVQNEIAEKIEGEPQNLLNIDESYEDEEMVDVSADDFSKALEQEAQKLPIKETDIQTLEIQAENSIDDSLNDAINTELKNIQ